MLNNVIRDIVFPQKIIYSEKVIKAEEILNSRITQVIMPFKDGTVIEKDGYIILDFGKEIYGNLRVLTGKKTGEGSLSVTLGESVAEAMYHVGEFGSCNDHSIHEYVFSVSAHSDFISSKTGFRFARIGTNASSFCIASVMAESEMPDLERIGFFRSDDEMINKIAETAAYTAMLCIQNGVIWDGIKRDKSVWIGDLHPEMLTVSQLYGAIPQIKNSLSFVKYYVPKAWVNCHPAYSAWWIICLADYYFLSADADFVTEVMPYLDMILSAFNNVIKEDGAISFENSKEEIYQDAEFFFDWPTNFKDDRKIGFASLIRIAMDKARFLQREFGKESNLAEVIYSRLGKREIPDSKYKQVEAFNFLSGDKTIGVKEAIAAGGSRGMTCFMGYYILTAAAKCEVKNTLDIIKDFYGGMISLGATTFWEDFDVEWLIDRPQGLDEIPNKNRKNIHRDYGKYCYKQLRHSLCHGWAAGVYAFFMRTILGVVPVAAGYKKIRITPNLLGLKFAEGKVPTPYGEIYVKHVLKDGKIETLITKPKDIEIVGE